MNSLWWQLPNPANFLDRVVRDLRQGKNVFLALPDYAPSDLRIALNTRVSQNDLWHWRPLSLQEDRTFIDEPVRLLFNHFALETENSPFNVKTLVAHQSFCGNLIWLEGLTASIWKAWQAFFEEYAYQSRGRSEWDRSLFCVPLTGELTTQTLLKEDLTLSIHKWYGVVERLDMWLYVSLLSKDYYFTSHLEKQLKMAIITELAGTDPQLVSQLFKLSFEELLAPVEKLTQIAKERNWHKEQTFEPEWHLGLLDEMEKTSLLHAAAIALQGDKGEAELRHRIWRGQIGILFPFLEQQRIRFLEELRAFLRVPFETPSGIITDSQDLELSHIDFQAQNFPLPLKTKQLLTVLKEIRHSLAHLQPIDAIKWNQLQRLLKK
jgi:hypothetical protein